MELKEMIKVMQHYEDGGEVEYSKDYFKSTLGVANKKRDLDLTWDWGTLKYRIKEPKQKITIEKWLIKDVDTGEYFIMESSDVDLTLKDFPKWRKLKLIETYEVEL